jgi:hypothetical protein
MRQSADRGCYMPVPQTTTNGVYTELVTLLTTNDNLDTDHDELISISRRKHVVPTFVSPSRIA